MRLPSALQRVLCRANLYHPWRKGKRVGGWLVRKCSACPARQEQSFLGGKWRLIPRKARTRRKISPTEHQGPRAATPEQDGAA